MVNPPSSGKTGAPGPVFIDFEGIDGSGKTTLSNRLAELLRSRGVPVHHARAGGVFRSEISKEIRTLTRDPRYLRMSNVTEFLLYVARDTQMIDEFIRPKLHPGNLVFSDRYLYSAITHSHHARGLPREDVDAVLNVASRGLWPDLVVYCDVDPLTSRIRKKIQKVRDQRLGDFGRKGLMGIGFREDMRMGFLSLAEEDPDRWLVIDNANSTIEQSLERICQRVVPLLESRGYGNLDGLVEAFAAKRTAVMGGGTLPQPLAERVQRLLEIDDLDQRQTEVYRVFFEAVKRLGEVLPGNAALFVSGLDVPDAHAIRETLIDREPAMLAHGLRGLRSPESIVFRQRLKEREPVYIARSLAGVFDVPEVDDLRLELIEKAPSQVILSVRGQDTDLAWELRSRLGKKCARELLMSLRGLDTERAWVLREKYAKGSLYPALLESLAGIDSPRANDWRDRLSEEFLPWVLLSLRGIEADWAWSLRADHVSRAPKIIIKTLGRSDDPRAWELRDAAKFQVKEVLDSLSGLDGGPAWKLRMELRTKWPNTAVSSLGAGNQSERAWKFRWEMLEEHPGNLLLVKHLVSAVLRSQQDDDDFDDDDEGEFT